jgi:hypothetical protein
VTNTVRVRVRGLIAAVVLVGAPTQIGIGAIPVHAQRPATGPGAVGVDVEPYHPFQQGVAYRIQATLNEATHVLTGRAVLIYTNRAPQPLGRLYFHQYLNAFRPDSDWARYDLRFGNRIFQDLGPEDHGFERLTAVAVDGHAVNAVYPFAPDSTVFFLDLPGPLGTGDSVAVALDWVARLASEPRRQGRAGRQYNWAHWYPRIAVHGRDGWEYRTHIRPGEFNGEFGTYDVTLDLAADQVMGATGVPVAGDPGWAGAAIPGSEPPQYLWVHDGSLPEAGLGLLTGDPAHGRKRVRWRAADVHHFAWSTSADYLYEGGRWRDTPIHLLWEADSPRWDEERVMRQQVEALDWLAEVFGEYAWPQITVTDRVEPGATEFPMLYMTSGGAVVHETMHMVAHGILANNEWREGWLDEGFASFLSNWFRESRGEEPGQVWGRTEFMVASLESMGRAEPVGLPAAEFSSFATYQAMTYGKGALLFRALRDELGEEMFRRGLRAYYDAFRFRQVTGHDFRAVMEAVSGRDLGPFFRRWLGE